MRRSGGFGGGVSGADLSFALRAVMDGGVLFLSSSGREFKRVEGEPSSRGYVCWVLEMRSTLLTNRKRANTLRLTVMRRRFPDEAATVQGSEVNSRCS